MCGIYLSISRDENHFLDEKTVNFLKARGPDSCNTLTTRVEILSSPKRNVFLTFLSTVLALRGEYIQKQPLHDERTGNVLCWNGEAWKYGSHRVHGNDGLHIFNYLNDVVKQKSYSPAEITNVLSQIQGPFAFVFYDAISRIIYFGRDRLGRRSLLFDKRDGSEIILASVTGTVDTDDLLEVDCNVIHSVDLNQMDLEIVHLQWTNIRPGINRSLPNSNIHQRPTDATVKSTCKHLKDSLNLRVLEIPTHSLASIQRCNSRVAVLFSGGLDCTLLARMIHEIIPQDEGIDLLNVAFENPRSMAAKSRENHNPYEACPDRLTGRTSFQELVRVCPQRCWRFVAINIPYSELLNHRSVIIGLMYPHNTEMDLSIAMALYFAARGTGYPSVSPKMVQEETLYTTSARVLLSGLGADELFGGYSRHAAAFSRGSFEALIDELDLDITRIGGRNLGRDDRIMSHWGKEVRYPYLDEDFVQFTLELPVWEKLGFRDGKHIHKHYEKVSEAVNMEDLDPAKVLLRMLMWNLDMRTAANERKRAIQFGAKTAKMEAGGGRKKGTDILTLE